MRPGVQVVRTFILFLFLSWPASGWGQTVVEMSLPTGIEILQSNGMEKGVLFLSRLANNYKNYSNVRVQSNWNETSLGTLAKALRTDFDGSGDAYIPDLTIWSVQGTSGAKMLLVASLIDRNAVLISTKLNHIKGMIAAEILEGVRQGRISLTKAKALAKATGIEMQVQENEFGEALISFFGHDNNRDAIVGKLVVVDPPDLVWN